MDGQTQPPAIMRGAISATMFPKANRLGTWREHFGEQFLRLDVTPLDDAPFRFDVEFLALPGLSLSAGSISALRCARTQRLVSDDNDDLILLIPQRGQVELRERGQVAELSAGDALVRHSSEVGETLSKAGDYLTLSIPRSAVSSQLGDLSRLGFAVIPGKTPALNLLNRYLGMLLKGGLLPKDSSPEARDAARLAVSHVHDLAGLVLGGSREHWTMSAAGGGLSASRLAAIRAEIDGNASNPEFTIEDAVRRLRISAGHIRKLLAGEGEGFSARLRAARLDHARELLGQRGGAITEVAMACGFGDISYFNRCFKQRFGMTPGEARNEMGGRAQ